MARFCGKVGFGQDINKGNGVWDTQITERTYFGDETRNYRRLEQGDQVNNNLSTSTQISIVSDSYANDHFSAIRYVEWAGVLWEVNTVNRNYPRLILELGRRYSGPTL